jgi:hypothetical protein
MTYFTYIIQTSQPCRKTLRGMASDHVSQCDLRALHLGASLEISIHSKWIAFVCGTRFGYARILTDGSCDLFDSHLCTGHGYPIVLDSEKSEELAIEGMHIKIYNFSHHRTDLLF